MQGNTTTHIWLRASQRVLGTPLGLGLTWLIAFGNPTPFHGTLSNDTNGVFVARLIDITIGSVIGA